MTRSGRIGVMEQSGEADPGNGSAGLGTTHGLSPAGLLAATSPGALLLHCLPNGPERTIRGVCPDASAAAAVLRPGDLVLIPDPLAPGRRSAAVTEFARHGAAGIVVPNPSVAEWSGHALVANLLLFSLGPGFTWPEVRRELTAALHGTGAPTDRSEPADGLRDLVRILAAEIGAGVLVTDSRLEPVAHALPAGADAGVREWILFGRPPAAERAAWVRRAGLRSTVPTAQSADGTDRTPWTLTALQAGGDLLGGLWTARTASEPYPSIVAAAAESAAALLVQAVQVRNPLRRRHADLLSATISGTGDPRHLVAALDIPAEAGLRLAAVDAAGREQRHVRMELLSDRVALRLAATGITAAVAVTDATLWVLASADRPVEQLTESVRSGPGERRPDARIAVSELIPGCDHITHAAYELRLLLDLDIESPIVTVEEWRSHLVIAEIADLADQRSCLRSGAIARLTEADSNTGSEYLPTLRAYFDMSCDLTRTAAHLHIHRNTLRYRLGRIRALSGLDLTDPFQRLAAELQLRVHDLEHLNLSRRSGVLKSAPPDEFSSTAPPRLLDN